MKIFNNNIEIIDIIVKDESYRYRTIMGENALTLTFSLSTFIEIPRGAYADFEGERYTLLKPQVFTEISSKEFEYTLILESAKALLGRYKFRDSSSKKLKFANTAKASAHLAMLVWNLNQRDSGWSVGECIDSTEKVLNFNHTYCDEALKMIAQKFDTEFEVVGKVISLKKIEYNKANPLPLSYGFGNGFKTGIKRENFDNSKAVEVLFVSGGEKNINASTYGSSELLLPKNQTLVYEGRTYISDENGYSIRRADKELFSHIEDSTDCSHIYPSRIGTISSVVVVDAAKSFYDFIDTSIPAGLDYSVCLMDGEKMTVIFQSGILEGKEFDVNYSHSTRKFEIVPQEIDGVTMPNATFKPIVGDTYAVFGISLPDAYVCDNASKTGSSWDMFREAAKYFFENEDPRYSFTGELDGDWTKTDWVNIGGKIVLGGYVSFTNEKFQQTPLLIRIVGVKDYINNPHTPVVELSNITVGGNSLSSELGRIDQNEVVVEESKKDAIRFAKRGFRDAKQTTEMLQSALLNFSSSISPLTVQTMQVIAGDETLQFEFVSSSTSTTSVSHNENYNPATKQFSSEAGILQHKTLGVTTLSSSHAASELKWWNMTAFVSAVLDDSSKSYYLYAKVSKTDNTGVSLLSENAIALESVAGYYHLLMGILNSENDGDRSYSQFYGYSELTPARMTVKKVVSPSGNTFFDLENEVIQGNIKFQSGVTVETGISNAKSEAVQLAYNDATAKVNNLQIGGENLVDDSSYENGRSIQTYGVTPSGTVSVDTSIFFDGSKSMKHTFTRNASNEPCGIYTINSQYDFLDKIKGKQIVHSIYVKASGSAIGRTIVPYLYFGATDKYGDNFTLDGSWQQIWMTAIVPTNSTVFFSYIFGNFTSGDIINVDCVFVGFGNKVTDWKLSKKDIDAFTIAKANAAAELAYANAQSYVNAIKTDLQSQIDGNITSWFYDYEPTTSNIPASNWNPDSVKDIHLGDLFYWTSKGWAYRYMKSGSVYSWTKISDTDVTKALNDAATAQTIANGKRTTFAVQPTTPYLVGDLWLNSGDLFSCNVARSTGTFIASDWSKGVKYTDDTVANQAVTAAQNAQTTATNAANSATTANSLLADIANDNKLTASEKQQTKTEWDSIVSEKTKNDTQADAFSVSRTAYGTAYTALSNYITALLADLTTTSDIVGTTFRTNFKAYYDARIDLLNSIAIKSKTLADAAQSQANTANANASTAQSTANLAQTNLNNLQIGGRNYFSNSEIKSTIGWDAYNSSLSIVDSSLRVLGSNSHVGFLATYTQAIDAFREVTISFYAKNNKSNQISIDSWINGNDSLNLGTVIGNSGWVKLIKTFVPKYYQVNQLSSSMLYVISHGDSDFQVKNIKIEYGNKATDWTEAPEDDYVKKALQSNTDINGGLFSTTLIQVRDTDNVVKGGMSGVQNDNVGIWTGGTYADAIEGIAKNILNKNGNFRLGGGLIDFDAATQIMLISALIRTAVSGDRLEISNSNNSITIYDYAGLEKVKISPKTVSPRGDIGGSTTVTTTTYAAHSNTIDEDGTANIGSSETITLDATKFFTIVTPAVNFSLSASGDYDGINKIHYTGDASVRVSLFDVSKGVSVWESNESVSSSNSSVSEDSGTIGAKTLTGMKGSVYRIDVTISISHEGAGTGLASASISAGQTLTGTIVNTISEIGLNGFNFIKSATEWLHLGDDDFSRRGATDIPAGLGGGGFSSGGGLASSWGKFPPTGCGGATTKTITHGIGDTDYAIIVTMTSNNTFYVTGKTASQIQVVTSGSADFIFVRTK